MSNLHFLNRYFGYGAAELEKTYLLDIFVANENIMEIVDPTMGGMKILVGKKGSGKSALLQYLLDKETAQNFPVVRLTPTDYNDLDFEKNASPAKVISSIYNSIVKAMSIAVGKMPDRITSRYTDIMKSDAVYAGEISSPVIDKMVETLANIGEVITDCNIKSLIPQVNSSVAARKRAITSYISDERKIFYVLLDDVDQICDATRLDYYDIVWYELLALFKISQELQNVYPIISIRKEIWRHFSNDTGNIDKYDQLRSMVYELNPSRDDLKSILEQRLKVCVKKYNLGYGITYEHFFDGNDCKVPNSTERRSWGDYLVSSSRENPRDIIQLVSMLIKNALDNNRDKISDRDIQEIAVKYSQERVNDLVNQNKDIFSNLRMVVESFADCDFELAANDVKKHLSTQDSLSAIIINGENLSNRGEEMIIALWKLLYNIGFINPRAADNTKEKKYTFIPYNENLVSSSGWNNMQRYSWDVHPCYRPYLIDIKEARKNMLLSQEDKQYKANKTRAERRRKEKK